MSVLVTYAGRLDIVEGVSISVAHFDEFDSEGRPIWQCRLTGPGFEWESDDLTTSAYLDIDAERALRDLASFLEYYADPYDMNDEEAARIADLSAFLRDTPYLCDELSMLSMDPEEDE